MFLSFFKTTKIINNYWKAKYDEFELIVNIENDYFNATELCKKYNKDFNIWFNLEKTQKLLIIKHDNKSISGIYIHSDLFISLAIWLSNNYYKKICHTVIKNTNAGDYLMIDFSKM